MGRLPFRKAAFLVLAAACATVAGGSLVTLSGVRGERALSVGQRAYVIEHAPGGVSHADLVIFHTPHCGSCLTAQPYIESAVRRFPGLRADWESLDDPKTFVLLDRYRAAYGIRPEDRLPMPIMFVGARWLAGPAAAERALPGAIAQYVSGASPPPALGGAGPAPLLGLAPLLAAAAADSVNPCALTTLIFFLSYLGLTGRRGRDLLAVGAVFTAAVWLTYFLVGLGLFRSLYALEAFPVAARLLYPVTAVLCLALAAMSARDAHAVRRGGAAAATLGMPGALRKAVHATIRRNVKTRTLVTLAGGTGVVVSLLHFTCTGQMYLPALLYLVHSARTMRRASALLALYDLVFVLPLIAAFTLAAWGADSQRLGRMVSRHLAGLKLGAAAAFALLGCYMAVATLQVYGLWYW